MTNRVSLAELTSAEIRLRPAEAVAIVAEICRQNLARVLPGIPSPGVIRLLRDGGIAIDGPVRASHDDVARAATLLNTLLPDFDAAPEFRASGALRLLVARAMGTLDLPPFQSLEDFTVALSRFTTLDARETVLALFRAWEDAQSAETTLPSTSLTPRAMSGRPAGGAQSLGLGGRRPIGAARCLGLRRMAMGGVPHGPSGGTVRAGGPAAAHRLLRPARPLRPSAASTSDPAPRVIRAAAYSPAFGPGAALYFHEQSGRASVLKVARPAAAARSRTSRASSTTAR